MYVKGVPMLMHMPADNTVVISQQQVSLHVNIRDGQLHVQLTSTTTGLDISDGLLGHMHVAGQPILWTKLQAGATH